MAALPDWPVFAINTPVRSVTSWASNMGATCGANVMACVAYAYVVGHTAAIPTPCSSRADGNPGSTSPTLRSGIKWVATNKCLRQQMLAHVINLHVPKEVRRFMRKTSRGHPCKMPPQLAQAAGEPEGSLQLLVHGRKSTQCAAVHA